MIYVKMPNGVELNVEKKGTTLYFFGSGNVYGWLHDGSRRIFRFGIDEVPIYLPNPFLNFY